MAAAAQKWDTLPAPVQQFFVQRAGVQPSMARQVYEQMGRGDRARAFGVTHGKTLEKADDYDREMALKVATGLQEADKYTREAPGREVSEAEAKARTAQAAAQTAETARKGRTEEAEELTRQRAGAQDREYWRSQGHDLSRPIIHQGANGVAMAHIAGDVDKNGTPKWTRVSPDVLAGKVASGEELTGENEGSQEEVPIPDSPPTKYARDEKGKRYGLVKNKWVRVP
jgi:hypothetical protein